MLVFSMYKYDHISCYNLSLKGGRCYNITTILLVHSVLLEHSINASAHAQRQLRQFLVPPGTAGSVLNIRLEINYNITVICRSCYNTRKMYQTDI